MNAILIYVSQYLHSTNARFRCCSMLSSKKLFFFLNEIVIYMQVVYLIFAVSMHQQRKSNLITRLNLNILFPYELQLCVIIIIIILNSIWLSHNTHFQLLVNVCLVYSKHFAGYLYKMTIFLMLLSWPYIYFVSFSVICPDVYS